MSAGFRRFLSLILCAVLMLTLLPCQTFASETDSAEAPSGSETEAADTLPMEEPPPGTEESVPETEESSEPSGETTVPTETAEIAEPSEETEPPESTEEPPESDPTETTEETFAIELFDLEPPEIDVELDWNLYFGQLHSHTAISDGYGSVEEAFAYAAQVENLDFFAVTDHSDSFDNAGDGSIGIDGTTVSQEWAAGKAAARAVTNEDFVGIFGYEMSWPEGKGFGHMTTFATPGWQSWKQEDFSNSLEKYYRVLTTAPGSVSQFNHPGAHYGDFENFGHYSANYDRQICLLEVAGEGRFTAYGEYTKALDAGWHVAPTTSQNNHSGSWGDAREDRTVILADDLTESALFDAIRHHRVYATADGDLTVYYELNGRIMGSTMGTVAEPEISVYLHDPTDEAVGRVEVIADRGRVVDSVQVDACEDLVYLYPPGGYSYYYLRVTQPDGDIAVTAPVWTDSFEDMGIASLTADTETPTQGQTLELSTALYNNERIDCCIEKLEFFIGENLIHSTDAAGALSAGEQFTYTFPYTHDGLGTTGVRLTVTGSVNGEARIWTRTLTLQYRPGEIVTGLLVDGSHGAAPSLNNLTALAGQVNMSVTTFEGELPEGGEILLISAPEREFEPEFHEKVLKFAKNGGSMIFCGRSDGDDSSVHSAAELNRLLETLGATMRFHDNTTEDSVNHGEAPDLLLPTVCNSDSPWCRNLTSAQYYAHLEGCTVDPGQGQWLVQGFNTTQLLDSDADGKTGRGRVLLAVEDTPWGGRILAGGSAFLSDKAMPLPENKWAAPRINQSILEHLLEMKESRLSQTDIQDIRAGEPGQVYRLRGYVTAGTSNPCNRFPQTIYIQDDSGGIAVAPFCAEGIQVGTVMDITGYLEEEKAMPVLRWIDYDIVPGELYRWVPKTSRNESAMDYEQNGGRLMQVEGTVTKVTLTADGKGISRLSIKDYMGDKADILIEDNIRSGASSENDLASEIKEGRKIRAMGISYLDENGVPVLRVRNCEEVVYVPPRKVPSDNPKTGDEAFFHLLRRRSGNTPEVAVFR